MSDYDNTTADPSPMPLYVCPTCSGRGGVHAQGCTEAWAWVSGGKDATYTTDPAIVERDREIARLRGLLARRDRAIWSAPHSRSCPVVQLRSADGELLEERECDCWKVRAMENPHDREIARLRKVLADAADVAFDRGAYLLPWSELCTLLAPYRRVRGG